jgi:hypothetical protein
MGESRMRIRFGDREFEAEGTGEWVDRQFQAFKQLIGPKDENASVPIPPLDHILRMRGRVVSLGVNAKAEDAVLVMLLGQRDWRKNDTVSGLEVMSGLRDSGIHLARADHILKKHVRDGLVVAMGQRRRRRYRLSSAGVAHAREIGVKLTSQVPAPA